jgi:adenylate cyclase
LNSPSASSSTSTSATATRPRPNASANVTSVIAAENARRNEDQVLAEAALLGERRVTIVRFVMLALFALSQEVILRLSGGPAPPLTPARNIPTALYVIFAIAGFVQVRRIRPTPFIVTWAPLLATVIDYAFIDWMGILSYRERGFLYPEMGVIVYTILVSFAVARYRVLHVAVSTALAIGSFVALTAMGHRLSAEATPFVAAGLVTFSTLVALTQLSTRRMFTELRRRDNLTRFLPRPIADRLLASGEQALAPVQSEVTVLFSDIRDFTTLAETLAPREVLRFLDEYFGHMSQVVKGHDGIVNKFLGDGMLAFWGIPDRDPDHAERAIKAALDMRRMLVELNTVREVRGLAPIRIGIGIHTGTVAAGMLGGADQHEYTVIGDAVNVASRIEGLTKSLGVDLLVSETTLRRVEGRFPLRRLADQAVKGRKDPVVVYALEP